MTKRINSLWKRVSFWNKIRAMLAAIGIGGEITLYLGNAYEGWNIVAAICTFIALALTFFATDINNDGIVDRL